jgi:hypothetical protein
MLSTLLSSEHVSLRADGVLHKMRLGPFPPTVVGSSEVRAAVPQVVLMMDCYGDWIEPQKHGTTVAWVGGRLDQNSCTHDEDFAVCHIPFRFHSRVCCPETSKPRSTILSASYVLTRSSDESAHQRTVFAIPDRLLLVRIWPSLCSTSVCLVQTRSAANSSEPMRAPPHGYSL